MSGIISVTIVVDHGEVGIVEYELSGFRQGHSDPRGAMQITPEIDESQFTRDGIVVEYRSWRKQWWLETTGPLAFSKWQQRLRPAPELPGKARKGDDELVDPS